MEGGWCGRPGSEAVVQIELWAKEISVGPLSRSSCRRRTGDAVQEGDAACRAVVGPAEICKAGLALQRRRDASIGSALPVVHWGCPIPICHTDIKDCHLTPKIGAFQRPFRRDASSPGADTGTQYRRPKRSGDPHRPLLCPGTVAAGFVPQHRSRMPVRAQERGF